MSSMQVEDECKSVLDVQDKSAKKKVDVLEAMAKYNAKKQQDRDLLMAGKPKDSVDTPEKTNLKPFLCHDKSKIYPLQEFQVDKDKEAKIGITEYVSQEGGFSAILKQRYSDFHVHEIAMDGNIVELTNTSEPMDQIEAKKVVSEEELAVLTKDQWMSIEEMVKSDEPKTVEIDVTEKSKDERQNIHKVLRLQYEKVVSNSVPVDGKTIMKIFKSTTTNKDRRSTAYTQFVLYKENLSTMEAISALARRTRIRDSLFMTAGTKDKRAITSQLVTVKNCEPKRLIQSMKFDDRIAVGNFTLVENPIELGYLKGNRFHLALRNVIGDESVIQKKLESLKETGFINYYGAQRFGTRHVPTHHIGRKLIQQKWQEAIDLILEPPPNAGKFQRDYDLTMARIEYRESKDAYKAYAKIRNSLHTIEAKLLLNLKRCGKDLVGALGLIPRNLRLTYIHAYQSFLWNMVVSKRLAKFGLKLIVGDLVYASPGSDEDGIEANTEIGNDALEAKESENERSREKESDDGYSNSRAQRNKRPVITIDERNIDKHTIYDLLLPLPGYDITYPSNEAAGWYTELLAQDGLSEMDFKQSVKTYNLGGAYRLVMSKPTDVKWKFVRYNDPSLSLIPSDWDRLENTESPPAAVEDGAFLALILEFNLPSSAYATMALREITKTDMSAEFQTSLNDAGSNKQPATSQPTEEATEEATKDPTEEATEEPEMKRIKQEPVQSEEL